jgi:hypothetical protein
LWAPSIPGDGILILAIWHFLICMLLCSPCLVHHFLFSLLIRKFISQWWFVQFTWDFLCHDPCHVYYFMVIFPEFVHVWIFILASECSYMCFVAQCLLFWLWNDDA